MANAGQSQTIIDKATLIPMGIFLAVCVGIFLAGAAFQRVDDRLASIEGKLEEFINGHHVESWVEVFRAKNPSLDIPEFRSP